MPDCVSHGKRSSIDAGRLRLRLRWGQAVRQRHLNHNHEETP